MMVTAALAYLENLQKVESTELLSVREDIGRHYQQRLSSLNRDSLDEDKSAKGISLYAEMKHARWLNHELRRVERTTLQQLYADDKINDQCCAAGTGNWTCSTLAFSARCETRACIPGQKPEVKSCFNQRGDMPRW